MINGGETVEHLICSVWVKVQIDEVTIKCYCLLLFV